MQVAFLEDNILWQYKAQRESDAERDKEGGDIGLYEYKAQIYRLFVQQEVIAKRIYGNVKHGIAPTARQVAEGLLLDKLWERTIHKVYYRQDDIL